MGVEGLLGLVIYLLVIGLVFWLTFWIVDVVGLPEPINKVIKVVIAIIAVIFIFGVLTGVAPRIR